MEPTPTFLAQYKTGPAEQTVWEPRGAGFLFLKYDCDGLVEQAAWVRGKGDRPRPGDLQLWFMWVNDMVTFKTEAGLSGTCWSDGCVNIGTVYDDDDPGPGTAVDLDAWVDRCVVAMRATQQGP